ncbi:hypothetical protein [Legionella sainthelensi]|uniref:hypothetical protein n=1 Tax=Legionella sainthelensi TaxID=28087 RepID=UPI0039E42B47
MELWVDEILEIADDSSKDSMFNEQGVHVFSNAVVTRAKLQIDTRNGSLVNCYLKFMAIGLKTLMLYPMQTKRK